MFQKKKKEFSGWLGDLSEEQGSALTAARKHLHDRDIYDTRYDDWMLLRFCRVKKFKVPEVIKMLDAEINFRAVHDLEHLFDYNFQRCDEYARQYHLHGYSGISKEGFPINIEILKTFDIIAMCGMTNKEDVIMNVCRQQEAVLNVILPICSKLAGKRIDQQITIYDMEGANYKPAIWNSAYRDIFRIGSDASDDNFPETSYQIVLINTPFIFSALWVILKATLSKRAVKKIKVLGTNFRKEL